MLGIVLNSFRNLGNTITEATQLIDFGPSFFGLNSTMDYVVPTSGQSTFSGLELATTSSNTSLSYNSLTIPSGITITSNMYEKAGNSSSDSRVQSVIRYQNVVVSRGTVYAHAAPGAYAPLIIRCKDTLTINGTISATGTGETANIGTSLIDYGEVTSIPKVSAPNSSVQYTTYTQLSNYFINNPFGNFSSFYFGTGGGNSSVVYSISSGGKKGSIAGGGSGGCIVLYYAHLYAELPDGSVKEYGIDSGFPIERIHANGVGGDCGTNTTLGGGMIILAARNIYLGVDGKVEADGTLASGVTQTGTNFAFLNNLPQLGEDQSGIYWDPTTNKYVSGTPYVSGTAVQRPYYYSSGLDFTTCNSYIDPTLSGSAELCGGAGCVFGYKVKS